jgi:hypothetical protein
VRYTNQNFIIFSCTRHNQAVRRQQQTKIQEYFYGRFAEYHQTVTKRYVYKGLHLLTSTRYQKDLTERRSPQNIE